MNFTPKVSQVSVHSLRLTGFYKTWGTFSVPWYYIWTSLHKEFRS